MWVSVQDGTLCKYTAKQHIFIYGSYVKSNSAHVCFRKFQQKFPGVDITARSTIHYLVNKFKTTGLVLDKKIKIIRHVLTEETLDDIGTRLEPRSLVKLAQQTDVSVSSARTATKLLKLCPYKITQVHSLQTRDAATRINFYNWFIQSVNEGTLDPQFFFSSDKA
jgi:hypothetical protein